jgi:quercetin dioxygenase-like cupin family protein
VEHHLKGPTTKGSEEWFTGDVWIDTVTQGHGDSPLTVAHVHFTPGARTAWHSHAIGQTLAVIEGEGRIQARGEPIATLRASEVVFAPGGEWHWHGAAPDHFMTHLAVSEGTPTWGEHVTDADYSAEAQ